MSKKRLYEIAKELGKESKEVVTRAKELGLEVKSHASSIEGEAVERLVNSFASKAPQTPKVTEEKQVKVAPVAKEPVANQPEKTTETAATPVVKPKSRNFKAEREARAKEQAERRQQQGNRPKKQQNDRRDGDRFQNRSERKNQGNDRRNQGNDRRRDQAGNSQGRPNPVNGAPKIDFKARAAALKAEQNAEYARGSEERYKQNQAAKVEQDRQQRRKREEAVATEVVAPQPKVEAAKATPVAAPSPAAVDTRRKKQARPDKKREDFDREEDGPRKQQKNRSSQNQVRNQRNSNWNNNKKNKKGKNNRNEAPKPVTERKFHELPSELEYTDGMTVAEIAKRIKREPAEIVKKLFMMGVMATQNQSLDGDTIELLLVDYGIEAKKKVEVDNADIERFFVEDGYLNPDELVERPPVVTIMGHVDHGKTTLLDTLRNSRVATGEAGGITQHIGAYQIVENGKKITFLDTPGHAAFTSMRARGASVTDITILVVAADDGVMPQTIEAINHSKAANVPIIVAINKIDKPGANPERVIGELAEHGVMSTAWGGDSEFVEISAKFNQNIDELLETVLLVAEIQELKADPTVRAMTNDLGRRVKAAGPSTPVSITGLNEAPMAGDHFAVYEDEKSARAAGEERAKRALMKQRQATNRVSLENLFDTLKAGEVKSVNVIIKADVQGSVEALAASLQKIEVEGVKVTIVHSAVGAINESDVTLAEASNAFIIGFNVRPTPQARQQAEADEVEIRLHSIIYKVIEEMEDAMKGMLDPEFEEKVIGEAVIRETFKVSKVGTIGGFMVLSGKVTRDSKVRVIRDGVVIYDGALASLKHYKDDVKEVTNGREGGLMIEGYNDIKTDDTIEAYIMEEIKK